MYKIQIWDEDCECWEDDDTYSPTLSHIDAESDLKEIRHRAAYPLLARIIKE